MSVWPGTIATVLLIVAVLGERGPLLVRALLIAGAVLALRWDDE